VFLFYLTFGQPALWLRTLLLFVLAGGVAWTFRSPR